MEGKRSRFKRFLRRDTHSPRAQESTGENVREADLPHQPAAPPVPESDDEANASGRPSTDGLSNQAHVQPSDLWRDAYAKLRAEAPSLVEDYSKILNADTDNDESSEPTHNILASQIINKKLEEIKSKEWKIKWGQSSIKVREKVDRIVRVIQIFTDIGSAATSADPIHAKTPWAGVCVLLSLIANDTQQQTAAVEGVEKVTSLIKQYAVIGSIYFKRKDVTLQTEFTEAIKKLYCHILEYQMKTTCYFSSRIGYRTVRNVVKWDDWSGLLAKIRWIDENCRQIIGIYDSLEYRNAMDLIEEQLGQQAPKVQEILDGVRQLLLTPEKGPDLKRPPCFMVPFYRDDDFVGRGDHLKAINSILLSQRRAALVGLGGEGKSQIAIEYCYSLREERPDTHIFWVHASSKTRFQQAYHDIAKRLNLPGWDDPKSNTLELVAFWLKEDGNGPWFIVLDNADDDNVFFDLDTSANFDAPLSTYLPQASHGLILVTSRNRRAAINLAKPNAIIDVREMGNDDAGALLRKKLPHDKSSKDDRFALIQELEHIPLAISQAAGYINAGAPRMTITKYLELFRRKDENRIRLLEQEVMKDPRRDPSTRSSVISTWLLSFDQIRKSNPAACDLLSFMCVLDRHRIPEFLINDGYDSLEFDENIAVLLAFSLITAEEGDTFVLHRLVQLATQKWLELQRTQEAWRKRALSSVSAKFPYLQSANLEVCRTLLPHAHAVMDWQFSSDEDLLKRAYLSKNLAIYHWLCGQRITAITRCIEALRLYEARLLPGNEDIVHCFHCLASIFRTQGRYKDAEDLYLRTIEESEKAPGQSNGLVVLSLCELTKMLSFQYKYDEAVKIGRQAVSRVQKTNSEHPLMTIVLYNLAQALCFKGEYKEAEEIRLQAVKTLPKTQSSLPEEFFASLDVLAMTIGYEKNCGPTQKRQLQRLREIERAWGPDHPQTIEMLAYMMKIHVLGGELAEAEETGRRVLELIMKILGEGNPSTAIAMRELAVVLRQLGKGEEAEDITRQSLDVMQRARGAKDPETLKVVMTLADVLAKQKKYGEAEKLFNYVLKELEGVLGADHPVTLFCLDNFAWMLYQQERYTEAERVCTKALAGMVKVLGYDHPRTAGSRSGLVAILRRQGRVEEAEELERTG